MSHPSPHLVIDARPRGPHGPLAGELVQGRPVLAILLDLALGLDEEPVVIHARIEEHGRLHGLVADRPPGRFLFATGPPLEGTAVLRTDRLYDARRLRRALRRRRDPESAVVWRLDQPHALQGAGAELERRQSYQPIGRFWALSPARKLAAALRSTAVRPNALTAASAALMIAASALVAFFQGGLHANLAAAVAIALALVLDTADGHLARLQGTATEFGRWLDGCLDELGDMTLHAAVAWSAFSRDGRPAWLLLGMLYGMGKYLFFVATSQETEATPNPRMPAPAHPRSSPSRVTLKTAVRLAGHADVRWHLWILLAAIGRLDAALVLYAVYFPLRTLGAAVQRGVRHA